MKLQEKILKEILDAQRYAVDPQHEAAFVTMLNRKGRRRTTAYFFLIAFTGLGLLAFSWYTLKQGDTEIRNQTESPSAPETVSIPDADVAHGQAEDIEVTTLAIIGQNENSLTDQTTSGSPSAKSNTINSSGSQLKISTSQQGSTRGSQVPAADIRPSASEKVSGTSAGESPSTILAEQNTERLQTTESDPDEISMSEHNNVLDNETGTRVSDANDKIVSIDGEEKNDSGFITQGMTEIDARATLPAGDAGSQSEETDIEAEIIPATRLAMHPRLSLGVSAMWSPVGGDGHLVQMGGTAAYRVSPQWSVRSDFGIGYQDGGFTFIKTSENEVFGFGLDRERHEMRGERLYTVYLSAEMARHQGKYEVFGGVEGQYLYGIKGDIQREKILLDVPLPVVTTSENTWVSPSGLQRVSLQSFLGLRRTITSRLAVAVSVRIPLMNTVRLSADPGQYTYEIESPGITPMLGLTYNFYQQ